MSAPVLTLEQLEVRRESMLRMHRDQLCASHEALRAERDAALAEVARMRPVVEWAQAWRLAGMMHAACVIRGQSREQEAEALSKNERDLWLAVDAYRAKEAPDA